MSLKDRIVEALQQKPGLTDRELAMIVFSVKEAFEPQACETCHTGFDHP